MSVNDFTGQFISSTFQRLLQLSDIDGSVINGTGSKVDLLPTTSSHALTASYVPGVTATTPGGSLWSIQYNSASVFQGSNNLSFNGNTSTLYVTGAVVVTGGITGSASFADNAFRSTQLGDDTNQVTVLQVGVTLGQLSNDTAYLADVTGNQIGNITITDVNYAISAGSAASADLANNATNATYAEYAQTASYVGLSGVLNQTVTVSGSVDISGSLFLNGVAVGAGGTETDPIYTAQKPTLATTGSNTFVGNQTITGSVDITGSFGLISHGSTAPTNPPTRVGLFYFTDTDLYISLE